MREYAGYGLPTVQWRMYVCALKETFYLCNLGGKQEDEKRKKKEKRKEIRVGSCAVCRVRHCSSCLALPCFDAHKSKQGREYKGNMSVWMSVEGTHPLLRRKEAQLCIRANRQGGLPNTGLAIAHPSIHRCVSHGRIYCLDILVSF